MTLLRCLSAMHVVQNESLAPHGMIDLATCMTVKSAEQKAQKRFALEVSTPDTTYLMYADTEKEKDDWIGECGYHVMSRVHDTTGTSLVCGSDELTLYTRNASSRTA